MYEEGLRLAGMAPNAVVKVPMTPAGLETGKRLGGDGIRTNVTLVFSPAQAILAAEIGAYCVSPFLGRLDDVGADGMKLLHDICEIFAVQGYTSNVLAASLRHPMHVVDAALAGADIATMPYDVFTKLVKHPHRLRAGAVPRRLANAPRTRGHRYRPTALATQKERQGTDGNHGPQHAGGSSSPSCSRSHRRWGSKEPTPAQSGPHRRDRRGPRRTASDENGEARSSASLESAVATTDRAPASVRDADDGDAGDDGDEPHPWTVGTTVRPHRSRPSPRAETIDDPAVRIAPRTIGSRAGVVDHGRRRRS